ncbi:MAG: stage V sporulation protein AB [Clostridia bacterium]|jgi:stage V sporulation protein AB
MMLQLAFCSVIGFSGGIIVGGGIIAFLTVLGVVSRLMHITSIYDNTFILSWIVLFGALTGCIISIFTYTTQLPQIVSVGFGMVMGIFVGLLASALAEVINVIPIFADRMNVADYVHILIIVLALGKVIGSLIYWLFPKLYT